MKVNTWAYFVVDVVVLIACVQFGHFGAWGVVVIALINEADTVRRSRS